MTQAFLDGVKLDTTLLDKLTAEMLPRASRIIESFGFKVASEASQGAAIDTGALRDSILSGSHLEQPLLFIVKDEVDYGVYVEFGTSKMAARPFMVPAIENNRGKFEDAFKALFV